MATSDYYKNCCNGGQNYDPHCCDLPRVKTFGPHTDKGESGPGSGFIVKAADPSAEYTSRQESCSPPPSMAQCCGSGDYQKDFIADQERFQGKPHYGTCNWERTETRADCLPVANCVEKVWPIRPQNYHYLPPCRPFEDMTVYNENYTKKPCSKVNIMKSTDACTYGGKFTEETVYKANYIAHCVEPYKKPPWAYIEEVKKCPGNFDGNTTYKVAYVPSKGCPAVSKKPIAYCKPNEPFEDCTEYKCNFVPFCPGKTTNYAPVDEITRQSQCKPFDGLTIYKSDFTLKRGCPAKSNYKPKGMCFNPSTLCATTTYSSSFAPFYFSKKNCSDTNCPIEKPTNHGCKNSLFWPQNC